MIVGTIINGEIPLIFTTFKFVFPQIRVKSTSYQYEPLSEPFIDFAKAYIRYVYSQQLVRQLSRYLESLRMVEMALYNVKKQLRYITTR